MSLRIFRARPRSGRASLRSDGRILYACDALEQRMLLSTIVWANRVTSDNFAIYGANAALARSIVDRAVDDWESEITNFNYSGGGNTYTVNITAGNLGGTARSATAITGFNAGKPTAANITLDDNGGGGSWYFDPAPGTAAFPEDGEFTSLLNSFTANGSGALTGSDFYTAITHELGHALGIALTPGLTLTSLVTNTGFTDPNDASATLLKYQSGTSVFTLTNAGAGHLFEGPAVGGLPTFPNDLMNSQRTIPLTPARRQLISPEDLSLLAKAYGYLLTPDAPSNSFLVNYSSSTHHVSLNEAPAGIYTKDDYFLLDTVGANERVDSLATSELIPNASVTGWDMNLGATFFPGHPGNDVEIDSLGASAPMVITSSGITSVLLNGISGLESVQSPISIVSPTPGSVKLELVSFSPTGKTVTVDNDGSLGFVAGLGPFPVTWTQSALESLRVQTTFFDDTINVLRCATPLDINPIGGNDVINLGNPTDGVRKIEAAVNMEAFGVGPSDADSINIDDTGDVTARTITHDTITIDNPDDTGRITGLAAAALEYDYFNATGVTIKTGSGADTINLQATGIPLTLNSAGGLDTVNVGTAASGVQKILGALSIQNTPSFSILSINDTGDSTARTITHDTVSPGTFGRVSGMAPANIDYRYNDVSSINLTSGSGQDTLNVLRDLKPLNLSSAGGAETVNIGNATTGVQEIGGAITITDPPALTTINVNDTGDSSARSISHDTVNISGADHGQISGLAPALIRYKYADTHDVTLTTGSAADTVNVLRNGSVTPLVLNSAGGNDIVNVGNGTNGLQSILGHLTIRNTPAFSVVTLNDTADLTGRTAEIDTFTNVDAFGKITGLAPIQIDFRVLDILSPLTIAGGGGADTFNFRSVNAARGYNVDGGGGSDAFNIGSAASSVDPIDAAITVSGGAASDQLGFNDQSEATALGFTVTPTTVARSNMATVNYGAMEGVTINSGGTTGKTNTINGTAAGAPVTINSGAATDTININEADPTAPVTIGPSAGDDTVNVNTDNTGSAKVIFNATQRIGALSIDDGGLAQVSSGANKVLSLTSLSFGGGGNGKLDLTDEDMIIDYSGASPIAVIQTFLTTGYAAGAWNGKGIQSSTAAAVAANPANTHKTAVGYAEASSLGLSSFSGQTFTGDALLLRYTSVGDANIDGNVTSADFTALAANFNGAAKRWLSGDFNFDTKSNALDFNGVATNYGLALPEPPLSVESSSVTSGAAPPPNLFGNELIAKKSVAMNVLE